MVGVRASINIYCCDFQEWYKSGRMVYLGIGRSDGVVGVLVEDFLFGSVCCSLGASTWSFFLIASVHSKCTHTLIKRSRGCFL